MIIGIDLNDVLRDFMDRFEEIYNKYEIGAELDLKKTPMTEYDLLDTFPFEGGIDELNHFLYVEGSLEMFGLAKAINEQIMVKLNGLNQDIKDDEEHQLMIVSREANNSIPASLYFLAKNSCKIETIKFYTKHEDLWEIPDLIISANPLVLDSKPEGKASVKIDMPYNKDTDSDFSLANFDLFIEDEDQRNKILNSKNIELL